MASYSKNTHFIPLRKGFAFCLQRNDRLFPHSFHALCGPRFFGGEFNLFKQHTVSFEPLQELNGMKSLLLIFHYGMGGVNVAH